MPTMTSNTTPPPYVASASAELFGNEAYRAFDNDNNYAWQGDGGAPWWLRFDWGAGSETLLGNYTVTQNDFVSVLFPTRTPFAWQMQGGNSAADRFSHSDLALLTATQISSALHSFVAADVGNVFQIISGVGFTPGFYEILSVSGGTATLDSAAGTPGSTAGDYASTPWFVLDTRTGQTDWLLDPVRTFACAVQTTKYRFFRLYITANNGDATYCVVTDLGLTSQFHHFY